MSSGLVNQEQNNIESANLLHKLSIASVTWDTILRWRSQGQCHGIHISSTQQLHESS